MGLAAQFEDIVKRQLNVHAAWLPVTNSYQLGDYGMITDGVFQKIGNVKEFNVAFEVGSGPEATLSFVSDSTSVVDASTGAEININPAGDVKANVTYKFNQDKSFLVKAPTISVSTIDNVNQIVQQLKQANEWHKRYIVVYQVYTAQNPLIISTVEGGTEVTIGGDGSGLKQFNVGRVSATFSLKTTKALGLEVSGKTGIIALGLFKLNWLTGNTQMLGLDDEVTVEDLNGMDLVDTM